MNDVDLSVLRKPRATDDQTLVSQWLGYFERALHSSDETAIAALFEKDSHWRDIVAFTWHISPFAGADKIAPIRLRPAWLRHRQRRKPVASNATPAVRRPAA